MVNIFHKDFHSMYNNIDDWILYGIFEDAIIVCGEQWGGDDLNKDYRIDMTKNEKLESYFPYNYGPVNKLKKW